MPSHCFAAIQRRIAHGVILKTLSVQGNKLVLPTALTVGVLLRFNRRAECFVKGKCVCCFASNVAGVVVLVGYRTEVYIVLTYKSVKSVVEVSRYKFAVCIVTILDIIPFTERVADNCFENEVRQSENAKSRPRFIGRPEKNIEIILQCESFLAPQHWTQIHFKFCHVWIYPQPDIGHRAYKKNAAR